MDIRDNARVHFQGRWMVRWLIGELPEVMEWV
jgi:hypothetical protein